MYTSYDKLEYFCLPIAELDYFDLTPTPPVNQHFDLIAGGLAKSIHVCHNHLKLLKYRNAKGFYESVGFKQSSDTFMLDGIPHIKMTWTKE